MRKVSMSMPSQEMIPWQRTVGIFNDYVPARRAADRLIERGIPLKSISIVLDGSDVPVDSRMVKRRGFAAVVGLSVGALVGAILAGAASATSFRGMDVEWPIAAVYGLTVGAMLGFFIALAVNRPVAFVRGLPGGPRSLDGGVRLVVESDEFDRASRALRPPRTARSRGLATSPRPTSGSS